MENPDDDGTLMIEMVLISWSSEDDAFIAIDHNRPGCSAHGATEIEAVTQLNDARLSWDEAYLGKGADDD